jgi:hypothetical protein
VVDTVATRIERRSDIIVEADSFGRLLRTLMSSASPNALRGKVTSNNRLMNICLTCNLPWADLHRKGKMLIREVTGHARGP